jgi:hypothetical protein
MKGNMMQETKIEYRGGPKLSPLMTVGEREIIVHVFKPDRQEMQALARTLDHVSRMMGEDTQTSPGLVAALVQNRIKTTDRMPVTQEVENVANN